MHHFCLSFVLTLVTTMHLFAHPPTLSVSDVLELRLPDVKIQSVDHFDGSKPNRGISVAHLDVHAVIGSSIQIELILPEEWNGRFAMGGGGGLVGSIQNSARRSANDGFATVGTDTGHQAGGTDGSWALNNLEALVNFGHVAIHRTAEVSKAIIHSYYGKAPEYSYFIGCSRGGGQAMMESQRYPDDFDGIVAGAPAFHWSGIAAMGVNLAQTMYPDPRMLTKTVLTEKDLDYLYAEVMRQVDEKDGLKDGIIDDPTAVTFDLSKATELNDAQKHAAKVVYDGVSNDDEQIYPGIPLGAEAERGGWFAWLIGPVPESVNLSYAFSTNIFKYFVFNDPTWDYSTYDFSNWRKDTRLAASVLNATNPDLSDFAKRGGKLILWHGWSDAALPATATVDYYEEVLKLDPKGKDYVRLFMVPGCYHCGGGPGVSKVDWLSEITNWVEGKKAPDRIVASKSASDEKPAMTRPLYPYPQRAEYTGRGDVHDAANFRVRSVLTKMKQGQGAAAKTTDGPKYNFVCADFAKGEVCVVNSAGEIQRSFKTKNPNDVWALPDGGVMFAWRGGVKQYDASGNLTFEWTSPLPKDEIHTCQPLADGNILIAQNGRSRLIEINRAGEIVKEIPVATKKDDLHMRFRMCRKLENGHYLCMISCDNEIRELNGNGETIRVIKDLPGVKMAKPHAVVRLPNGNTLFSTGAGAMAVEVDKQDKVVWKLTPSDVPNIEMGFMTGLSRLPNGNTILCFYQGSHHLIEVTPDKKLVWKWRLPSQKTVVSVQVLDENGDVTKGRILK